MRGVLGRSDIRGGEEREPEGRRLVGDVVAEGVVERFASFLLDGFRIAEWEVEEVGVSGFYVLGHFHQCITNTCAKVRAEVMQIVLAHVVIEQLFFIDVLYFIVYYVLGFDVSKTVWVNHALSLKERIKTSIFWMLYTAMEQFLNVDPGQLGRVDRKIKVVVLDGGARFRTGDGTKTLLFIMSFNDSEMRCKVQVLHPRHLEEVDVNRLSPEQNPFDLLEKQWKQRSNKLGLDQLPWHLHGGYFSAKQMHLIFNDEQEAKALEQAATAATGQAPATAAQDQPGAATGSQPAALPSQPAAAAAASQLQGTAAASQPAVTPPAAQQPPAARGVPLGTELAVQQPAGGKAAAEKGRTETSGKKREGLEERRAERERHKAGRSGRRQRTRPAGKPKQGRRQRAGQGQGQGLDQERRERREERQATGERQGRQQGGERAPARRARSTTRFCLLLGLAVFFGQPPRSPPRSHAASVPQGF